jgi:hypothetical protein
MAHPSGILGGSLTAPKGSPLVRTAEVAPKQLTAPHVLNFRA